MRKISQSIKQAVQAIKCSTEALSQWNCSCFNLPLMCLQSCASGWAVPHTVPGYAKITVGKDTFKSLLTYTQNHWINKAEMLIQMLTVLFERETTVHLQPKHSMSHYSKVTWKSFFIQLSLIYMSDVLKFSDDSLCKEMTMSPLNPSPKKS